ncbi:MAG: diguanylate cyclase [Spirochaetales bacterium]|nr:diguanylate cyclase [Spirochaetales bacterium]
MGDILHDYDFLFSDTPLSRELAGLGFLAIDFVNKRWSVLTDWNYWFYNREKADIEPIRSRIHPDFFKSVQKYSGQIKSGKITEVEKIFKVKNNQGEWICILHKGAVVYKDEDGNSLLYVGTEADITHLKETEEEVRTQKFETESRANEAENLLQIGALITSSLNIDETVNHILDHVKTVVPYERASVQILSKEGLRVIGGLGYKDMDKVLGRVFPYPEKGSLSTRAIDDQKLVICSDIKKEFPKFYDPDESSPTVSWLGIPLIFRGEVLGLLSLDHTEENFYQDSHLKLATGFASFVSVALANARQHEKTHKMAMEDVLMKIGTRYCFEMQGSVIFANAQRNKEQVSVIMADIDHFKKVNDTYGHNVGDMVLREVGAICRRELRSSDIIARYGGEEIIFLFSNLDIDGAQFVMERVRKAISDHKYKSVKSRVSISVGLVTKRLDRDDTLEKMTKAADEMLYKAKESGRDKIVALDLDM